jgi:hypothetical protein
MRLKSCKWWSDATLQNFIYKHTIDLKIVQRNKKEKNKEKSQDVKLAQTRCQNLSMSKTYWL